MAKNLIILTYHRVLDAPDALQPGEISTDFFADQMRCLSRYFNVLPLLDGCRQLSGGTLPPRAVSITFDDGYADNYRNAWPVLKQFDLPATVFVATGFLDGGRMWNDTVIECIRRIPGTEIDLRDLGLGCHVAKDDAQRVAAIHDVILRLKYLEPGVRNAKAATLAEKASSPVPDDLMLEIRQVKELSRSGIEIGAHTITHPILRSTEIGTAREEIVGGKRRLEEIVGSDVRSFAYPNGKPGVDYDPAHVELVREAGFECAVSTTHGAATASSDIWQLPRIGPWAESTLRFGLRTLRATF
ncbi:MAG TPA: polysaccharide deacetylase family protein [Woeseiaceae bacterium]|nr:polysaccharide deacetylase family protein [Woeseiaceae bacterium]